MITNQDLPIYHLTPASHYHRQPSEEPYRPATLAEEGFIHCTAGIEKLLEIANTFFATLQDELLALEIDPAQLTSPLIFEPPIPPLQPVTSTPPIPPPDPNILFPHIYGSLDRQAIISSFALQRSQIGQWQMPETTTDH